MLFHTSTFLVFFAAFLALYLPARRAALSRYFRASSCFPRSFIRLP